MDWVGLGVGVGLFKLELAAGRFADGIRLENFELEDWGATGVIADFSLCWIWKCRCLGFGTYL